MIQQLSQLPTSAKFRLYHKYRDGKPRPKLQFGPKGSKSLQNETLAVIEQCDGYTLCRAGSREIPLWGGLRIRQG